MRKATGIFLSLILILTTIFTIGLDDAQGADNTYTVQRGDTLTGIAARFGVNVSVIAEANGITNVNNIYGGQVLRLPTSGNTASNTPSLVPTTGEQAYIIQPGDTLSGIASRYNVAITTLASLNGLSVMNYVYVGQNLRIPGTSAAASPATTTAAPTEVPATATQIPVAGVQTYTVHPGDNLGNIATRYGVSVDSILAANKLANPNYIFSGQVLTIPGGQGGVSATVQSASPAHPVGTGKWIDVNLSQQRLVAYEGNTAVFSSVASTGVSNHPTVTGTFNIYLKYTSQAMSGGSGREYYYLPGVPYVMYFYDSYAIHGTYWHNNFGHPMSHGCVNLPTPAAQFMYNWATVGTPVTVHY